MTSTVIQPTYDNGIKPSTDTTYPWNASTGLIDVNFAGTIGTTNAIQFIKDGYQFAWKPDTVEVLDDQGSLTAVSTVNPNATAQVWKNRLTYVGTTPLTSDEFEVQGNQLKHTVRMVAPPNLPSGYTGNPQFLAIGGDIGTTAQDWNDIDLYADGVSHRSDFTTTDDLRFVRISDGTEIYRIPRITVIDADGNETLGEYKLVFQPNNVVTLYLLVPWTWMQDAAYPVAIDPTVVVSSGYDTSGNGGRRIVHLSNGWIVSLLLNNSGTYPCPYWYVSKDNGQTWSLLAYSTAVGGAASSVSVAMAYNGTEIYTIVDASNNVNLWFFAFDATTVSNASSLSVTTTIESQTSFGSGVSLAVDGQGNLYAAWCSKNSTYPNSFNIRYSKGTVSGTTVSWATPTQLTTFNVSGNNGYDQPCITIYNGNPFIVGRYGDTSVWSIVSWTYNGSSWTGNGATYGSGSASYTQSNPCVAIDGNGVIHAVWFGEDATYPSTYQIKYSKSTDGGNTWSAAVNLTTVSTANAYQKDPSITIDPNNDLYVFFDGYNLSVSSTMVQIAYIKCTAGTWGSVNWLTSITGGVSASNPQTLWSMFNMNSSDAIRYIWMDGGASQTVKYDSITLNNPPNAPTNLSPTGGNTVGSVTPNLSGTFSDPDSGNTMSALQVQVYRNSDNTLMWDSGKTAMTTTTGNQNWSITVPSSANLVYGTQYYWKATTWDNSGAQGAWSGNQVFFCEQVPTVTITAPTASQVVTTSSITAQLSYSQVASVAEGSYQFQLLDSTGTNVVQDSGVISGNNNQYTFNGLANNTTYQIVGYATTKDGVQGTSSKVTFSTSFTPPNAPTVTSSVDSTTASVTVSWTNSGTGQAIQYNRLYKQVNGSWQLYQDQLNGTSYQDYLVGNGTAITYGVSAMGTNGVESSITSVTATPSFSGDWLYDPTTGKQFQFLYNRAPYDMATMEERQEFQTFGNKPMIRRGPLNARTGTLDALMVQIGSSQSPIQQLQAFEANMANHPAYYLKTSAGEVLKVDVHTPKRKMPQEYLNNQAIGITVNWTEVS